MRTRLIAAILLGAVAVVAGWTFLAPPALGGQTSYVVTRGESMLPALHTGDLVLVRTATQYRTGDVIANRNRTLDAVVLHRVVEARPGGLVTRGDSNDWTDPDLVAPAEVIGRLWLTIPKAGAPLAGARGALPFVFIGLLLAATADAMRPRRPARSRPRRRSLMHRSSHHRAPLPLLPAAGVLLAIAAALLVLSVRGPVAPAPAASAYSHSVEVTYTAAGDPQVYDGGRVLTGDPVFTNLTPQVDVAVHYQLRGDRLDEVQGTLALNARLSAANGWQRTTSLTAGQPLDAGQGDLRATLDISELQDQLATLQERTGTADGGYRLELLPVVAANAPQAQTSTGSTDLAFDAAFGFRLQGGQLVLDAGEHERGAPLTQSATQSTGDAGTGPDQLQVAGLSLPVSHARLASAVLAALGLALAGAVLLRRRADPLARLDRPVVSVAAPELTRPALETATLNALFDLAQRYDRPVLHTTTTAEGPVYLVQEGGTWYQHSARRDHTRKRASSQ